MEREQPDIGDPEASEIDEEGRNITQQRLDDDIGMDDAPVDEPWVDDEEQ